MCVTSLPSPEDIIPSSASLLVSTPKDYDKLWGRGTVRARGEGILFNIAHSIEYLIIFWWRLLQEA